MPKALVITVGTGQGVEYGISFSIERQNPAFILFLCSHASRATLEREPLSRLLEARDTGTYCDDVYDETEDVEKLAEHYREVIRTALIKGREFHPSDIAVDHTSGTKSMSVALGYVALELGVGSVAYVSGQRDESGRVISGTERFLSFTPNELYFRKHRQVIIGLFNQFQFHAALRYIQEIKRSVVHPDRQKELEFLAVLCKAYQAWDTFQIEIACQKFEFLSKNFPKWVEQYRLEKKIQDANHVVHKEKGSAYALQRALDLLANSDRRYGEGRFDQAAAILYRLLEFIAQVRLNEKRIDTSSVDLDRIPESLRDKWGQRKGPEGKIKVSLVQAFELLADLDVQTGKNFIGDYQRPDSDLQKVLDARNRSCFAHGFQPVGDETAKKMREIIVRDYLPDIITGDGVIEDLLHPFRFPSLTEPNADRKP